MEKAPSPWIAGRRRCCPDFRVELRSPAARRSGLLVAAPTVRWSRLGVARLVALGGRCWPLRPPASRDLSRGGRLAGTAMQGAGGPRGRILNSVATARGAASALTCRRPPATWAPAAPYRSGRLAGSASTHTHTPRAMTSRRGRRGRRGAQRHHSGAPPEAGRREAADRGRTEPQRRPHRVPGRCVTAASPAGRRAWRGLQPRTAPGNRGLRPRPGRFGPLRAAARSPPGPELLAVGRSPPAAAVAECVEQPSNPHKSPRRTDPLASAPPTRPAGPGGAHTAPLRGLAGAAARLALMGPNPPGASRRRAAQGGSGPEPQDPVPPQPPPLSDPAAGPANRRTRQCTGPQSCWSAHHRAARGSGAGAGPPQQRSHAAARDRPSNARTPRPATAPPHLSNVAFIARSYRVHRVVLSRWRGLLQPESMSRSWDACIAFI